jgi:hypothetical protein
MVAKALGEFRLKPKPGCTHIEAAGLVRLTEPRVATGPIVRGATASSDPPKIVAVAGIRSSCGEAFGVARRQFR